MTKKNNLSVFMAVLLMASLSAYAESELTKIVKEIQPAVVTVITRDKQGKEFSLGSGFFIDPNGTLITNHHVLEGASSAYICAYNGNEYMIESVLAADPRTDLIKLRANLSGKLSSFLEPSKLGPEIAERVIVVGSPLGLEQSVTEGIVSAIRSVEGIGGVFQITAPISAGSSGSPVIDMKGKVIGVATFQFIEGQNINFAIPIERAFDLGVILDATILDWSTGMTKLRTYSLLESIVEKLSAIVSEIAVPNEKAQALFDIAKLQLQMGELNGAKSTILKLRQIPDEPITLQDVFVRWRAETLLSEIAIREAANKDLDVALQTIQLIRKSREIPKALCNIAEVQFAVTDPNAGRETFRMAIALVDKLKADSQLGLEQKDSKYLMIASLQAKCGDFTEAIKTVSKMKTVQKVKALCNIAEYMNEQGHLETASNIYDKIKLESASIEDYIEVSESLNELGDVKSAKASLAIAREAIGRLPAGGCSIKFIRLLALTLVKLDEVDEAIRVIDTVKGQLDQVYLDFYRPAIFSLTRKNDFSKALSIVRSVEDNDRVSKIGLYCVIAEAHAKVGNVDESREIFNVTKQLASMIEEVESKSLQIRQIARAQARAGDVSGAIETAGHYIDNHQGLMLEIKRAQASRYEIEEIEKLIEEVDEKKDAVEKSACYIAIAKGLLEKAGE